MLARQARRHWYFREVKRRMTAIGEPFLKAHQDILVSNNVARIIGVYLYGFTSGLADGCVAATFAVRLSTLSPCCQP